MGVSRKKLRHTEIVHAVTTDNSISKEQLYFSNEHSNNMHLSSIQYVDTKDNSPSPFEFFDFGWKRSAYRILSLAIIDDGKSIVLAVSPLPESNSSSVLIFSREVGGIDWVQQSLPCANKIFFKKYLEDLQVAFLDIETQTWYFHPSVSSLENICEVENLECSLPKTVKGAGPVIGFATIWAGTVFLRSLPDTKTSGLDVCTKSHVYNNLSVETDRYVTQITQQINGEKLFVLRVRRDNSHKKLLEYQCYQSSGKCCSIFSLKLPLD